MKAVILILIATAAFAQTTTNGSTTVIGGRVNNSGAAATQPHRTGTGSPVGRDACSFVGETYFQSDATAGSNVWASTATGTPCTWSLQGGGAVAASQLNTLQVTRTSPTVLTIGANCSTSTPCNVQAGTSVLSIVTSATATISSGNPTARIWVDNTGAVNVGYSTSSGVACVNATCAPSISSFSNSGIAPTWQWVSSTTAGQWDAAGGTDLRSVYHISKVVSATGPAMSASQTPTGTTVTYSPTSNTNSALETCAPASASGTAYVCSTSPTFTPVKGSRIIFQPDVANTGAATLAVNGASAASITKQAGAAALVANDILASPAEYTLVYDGSTWEMQSQSGNASGGTVTGPVSSTTGNVPQFADTSGKVLNGGLPVTQIGANSSLVETDSSGDIVTGAGGAIKVGGVSGVAVIAASGNMIPYFRIAFGNLDTVTCTAGAASLSTNYTIHRVDLNNQTSCAITFTAASQAQQIATVLLCNGGTTATTSITWTGVKGATAAGGTTGQCALQSFYYDATNSVWYGAGAGTWN
ncbi:MAG TPA: hypothetical protein VN737_04205 [Bryobacteraceae bacterium]|nr:hypothetical protein [Bryobacteraceae bacterium]